MATATLIKAPQAIRSLIITQKTLIILEMATLAKAGVDIRSDNDEPAARQRDQMKTGPEKLPGLSLVRFGFCNASLRCDAQTPGTGG
jgi:hypothetical protein